MDQIHKVERSYPIKINQSNYSSQRSLNETTIDPSKMSPPNFFMDKLQKRMDKYYTLHEPKTSVSFSFNTKNINV